MVSSPWSTSSPSLLARCVRRACMPSRQSSNMEAKTPKAARQRIAERNPQGADCDHAASRKTNQQTRWLYRDSVLGATLNGILSSAGTQKN